MCGIAGFINSHLSSDSYSQVITDMLQRIDYRGPDELGYYFDESAAIGSVRLSIIDLTTGTQPFFDDEQRYCLVYNGELYNYLELKEELKQFGHVFSTTSDTEVLLKSWIQWGEQALKKFNGGYSFAIYDRVKNSCLLVRDRFGKRPLYYTTVNGALLFASELKCFLDYPGMQFAWDTEAVKSVVACWTPLPDQTVFNAVKQIPPGCCARYAAGALEISSYYELDFQPVEFAGTEQEAVEATRNIIKESVKLRMRSDVEVGTYLSGGLDSSIVTQLVVEESTLPVHSFSVCFEEKEFDESEQQQQMSAHLGTKHQSFLVSNRRIADDFPLAVWHAEVPLFRTALVPLYSLSKIVNNAGIKVVLTGEGSDEAFLGYDIFKETHLRQRWKSLNQSERESVVSKLYPYLKHFSGENVKALAAVYDQFADGQDEPLFSHELRFRNSQFGLRMLGGAKDGVEGLRSYANLNHIERLEPIRRTQWLEFKTLLAGYLLSSQGDRMSLANSVENRCPFLDHNVVEFANSLPIDMRLKNGTNEKYLLKKAFADVLPGNIVNRFKQPYRAPDAAPFIGSNRPDYVDDLLQTERLSQLGFLDIEFCKRFASKMLNAVGPEAISPRENQALVSLLSLVMLDSCFIQNQNTHLRRNLPVNFSHRIDGRVNGAFKEASCLHSSK